MRPSLLVGILAASLLAFGCKGTGENRPDAPAATAAQAADYKPTGEIIFAASGLSQGANFDATRVVGNQVNLSRRSDGSWAGQLKEHAVDVSIYPNRLVGVDLLLTQQQTGDGVIIIGQYQGQIMRFEVSPRSFLVRTPRQSFTFPKVGEGQYGEGGKVKLVGDAASPNPPWPQFALALVGAFT